MRKESKGPALSITVGQGTLLLFSSHFLFINIKINTLPKPSFSLPNFSFSLIYTKKKVVAICLDAPKSDAFKHTRCCKFEQKLIPSFSRGLPKFSPFYMINVYKILFIFM
jgi:hypothetical protein